MELYNALNVISNIRRENHNKKINKTNSLTGFLDFDQKKNCYHFAKKHNIQSHSGFKYYTKSRERYTKWTII